MEGRSSSNRRRRWAAAAGGAVIAALIAMGGSALADPSSPSDADAFKSAMAREQLALKADGGARISELARASRPRPRSDANVTVASRNIATTPVSIRRTPAAGTSGKLDVAALDAMPPARGNAQWQCLATAIYFEARGEPISGQIAVAEVILNRVDSGAYPNTICAVTNQGVGSAGRACQFSYACDGRSDVMTSSTARSRSEKLAALMLAGRDRTITAGATHFHTRAVRPGWAGRMTRTATIGHHLFYR